MRQLLQNKVQRQLTFIERLMHHSEPINILELSDYLDTSTRTLQMDISEINQALPFLHIHSSLGMVSIHPDENTGFSHIYKHFIRHDVHFNILHMVFFEENISIAKLSQRLFISEASIYRAIRSINRKLKHLNFNFKIMQTPCIIIGDEVEVRRFYYNLLFESYSILEWPFEFTNYEAFTYALQAIAKEFQIQLYLSNMQKFSIFIGVNLVRHLQGFYLEDLTPTEYFVDSNKLQDKVIEHLGPVVEGINHDQWTTRDTLNVFFPFFHTHYAYNYTYFIQRAGQDLVFNQSFLWINHMIETLRSTYKIRFTDTKSLILSLHNNACLGLLTPGVYPVLHANPLQSVNIVEKWSPKFYMTMRQLIENYLASVFKQSHPYVINYVLFQFIVHLQDYLEIYMSEESKVRLAIMSDYNFTHAKYYHRLLQTLMPKQLDLTILDDYVNIEQDLKDGNFDILISSFNMNTPEGVRFYKVNLIPTSDQLTDLMTLIQDVRIAKVNSSRGH